MKIIITLLILSHSMSVLSQEKTEIRFNPQKTYTQEQIDLMIGGGMSPIELEEFKKILMSNSDFLGWTRYYYGISRIYFNKKELDSAIYFAEKGIELYTKSDRKRYLDEFDLMRLYMQKGIFLSHQNKFKKAIIFSQKSLDLTKKHPYKWASFIKSSIGRSHMKIGNDSIALTYFIDISKDSLYMKYPGAEIRSCLNLGILYSTFKDYEKEKKYYKKGIQLSETSNYKILLFSLYGNLGFQYQEDNYIDSAVYFFKKAIESYENSNHKKAKLYCNFYKSYINIYDGKYKDGIKGLKKIKTNISEFNQIDKGIKSLMVSVFESLAVAYIKTKKHKELENLLKESNEFLTNFYESHLKKDLVHLEIKYKTKERNNALLELKKEQESQAKIISQQTIINYSLASLVGLVLLFSWLFSVNRKQKNKYEIESLNQRLLRSQMNPHFLFNALNTVSSLVHKNSSKSIEYINRLANLLRAILINSREEFVSIKEELNMLEDYLELESSFSKKFEFEFIIDGVIDKGETIIPPMLIQPFVENSIQHGFTENGRENKISIEIINTDNKGLLLCKISDNGMMKKKPIATINKHKPVSSDIVKERLNILNKKFKVNSRFEMITDRNEGTVILLYLPYLLD